MLLVLAIMFLVFTIISICLAVKFRNKNNKDEDIYDSYRYHRNKSFEIPKWLPIPFAALTVISLGLSVLYAQDPGESIVIQNWGGSLAGHSEDAGFHVKAPWQTTVKYDVRNNILSFVGDGEEDYAGGSCKGPQLTINDKGGASANIDVQVNYALDPSYVETLYADYGTQENFVHAICAVDIRATAREVAGGMDTITILTNRGDFSEALYKALETKWNKYGINIEQVNVQDVRYGSEIHQSYAKAQQAEIDKSTALNQQEVEKTKADTEVEVAKRKAEANRELAASLTPEVLEQQRLEALYKAAENGSLIVVPDGATPLIDATK